MIEFIDGPAARCKGLCIRRAPRYLRVTHREGRGGTTATGEWDALDHPSDDPEPNETLYAYELMEHLGMVHLRMARPRSSGFFVRARYRFVEPQPDDATMRSTRAWLEWCEERAKEKE